MNGKGRKESADPILDAAETLLKTRGAEDWTLADLAQASGVPEETVRSQFATEWHVFEGVVRRDDARFEQLLERASAESAGDRVVALFETLVPEYDWTFWIELWSIALRDERAAELRAELDARFYDVVEAIILEGVESGEFTVPCVRTAAVTIATMIDSMSTQATLGDTTVRPNYALNAGVTVASALLGAPLRLPKLNEARSG
jgi:AcrR family transcriptional regulator